MAQALLRRPGALLLAAALCLGAAPARADDAAAAEALFQQAKLLKEAGRWADACPKFEASYKLDRTLGTLLNLADCEEHVNRVATAWAHWGEAVEMAQKTGDKRADFASKRREAIAPRLAMIRIDVAPGKSSLEVQRDGIKIAPAAFGVPLPSDAGPHTITVVRGAETLKEQTVVAKETETSVVSLDLVAIEKAAPPPAPPVVSYGPRRTAGFTVLGFGVAAFAAAAGLEIAAIVTKNGLGSDCVGMYCTRAGADAVNRARTFANAGQWVGIGSLLVTAVGVTLVLTSPVAPAARTPPSSGAALTVSPWAGPGAGGLAVGGAL